jgi:hypothetical protein
MPDGTPSSGSGHLSYRYRVTYTVVMEADGLHADGDGATATRRRLERLLANDPRVIEVRPPSVPVYIGAKPRPR